MANLLFFTIKNLATLVDIRNKEDDFSRLCIKKKNLDFHFVPAACLSILLSVLTASRVFDEQTIGSVHTNSGQSYKTAFPFTSKTAVVQEKIRFHNRVAK
jgi:hypothetical protein